MKTIASTVHAASRQRQAVAARRPPDDQDLARRCLRAERITLGAVALAVLLLFAASGSVTGTVVAPDRTAFAPAFGWPL